MPWVRPDAGAHQRLPDDVFLRTLVWVERSFPRREDVSFALDEAPLREFLATVTAAEGRHDLEFWHHELWRLPDRFLGRF
jgi:hypothetical protein